MWRILILLGFLFSSSVAVSQTRIHGSLVDKNGQPIAGATVEIVSNAGSQYAKYETSASDGSFSFDGVPAGSYLLLFSGATYAGKELLIEASGEEIKDVGSVLLAPQEGTLEEVEVVARKKPAIEVMPDKTVFNVSQSPTSSGLNGLELLRKAPGVVVDNDENIILRGSRGVRIFIDDKPTNMSGSQLARVLAGLRAEDIESIEIITSPSAKYEAEGAAGIVNIKMKKNKEVKGWVGSLTADVTSLLYIGTYRGSYSGIATYSNQKTSFTASYGFANGPGFNAFFINRNQSNKRYVDNTLAIHRELNHNIRFSLSHQLNAKHSISAGIRIGIYDHDDYSNNSTNVDTLRPTTTFVERLVANTKQLSNDLQFFPAVSYQYRDTLGNTLSISTDYSWLRANGNDYVPNIYYSDQAATTEKRSSIFRQTPYSTTTILAIKADYARRWEKVHLEAGLKYSSVKVDNLFKHFSVLNGVETLEESLSSGFVYDENILAAYAQIRMPIGKFTFSLGLRNEYTNTIRTTKNTSTGQVVGTLNRSYNDLFPSAGLTYTPNKIHSFALQYSRRIQRPSYQRLNPFRRQSSELQYEVGNPDLTPQYANKVEVIYSLLSTASLSLGYLHTDNVFSVILLDDAETPGVQVFTQQNVGVQQIFSVGLSSPLRSKKASWWSGFINLSYNYIINDGVLNRGRADEKRFHVEVPGAFNMYMEQSARLPKGFSISISGWLNTESVWQSSIQFKTFGSLDAAIQKTFFDGKLRAKIAFSDILNTAFVQFNNLNGSASFGTAHWPARRLGVNISYRFGNQQQGRSRGRRPSQSASDDEQKRAKEGGGMMGGGR